MSGFKKLTIVALVLAALGSILTIVTPDILSNLTDEISNGLVMNKDNFEKITKEVTGSLNEENISKVVKIDFSEKNITSIMMDNGISSEDKESFRKLLGEMQSDSGNKVKLIANIPDSILHKLVVSNKEDTIKFIKSLNGNVLVPDSIAKEIFKEFKIDGVKISVSDQRKFLEIVSGMNENMDVTSIYAKVDEMPSSIKKELVEPYMNIDKIKNIAIFLVTIYLISAIFTYFESILMCDVSNNFARKLRGNISSKINKLPLKYFDKHAMGDTLSRVTNDVDTIAQSMNQSLSTLVSAITLFLGTTIMMFVTNWVMAITAILASLFGFVFMAAILGKLKKKYFVAKQKRTWGFKWTY